MLSVNQINAQIKLTEIWKAVNNVECPLKIIKMKNVLPERPLRSKNESENNLMEVGSTEFSKKTFVNDGVRLWNKGPGEIKHSKSLFTAKKERQNLFLISQFEIFLNSLLILTFYGNIYRIFLFSHS